VSNEMPSFLKTFLAARAVSTPLVLVRTADPASTVRAAAEAIGGTGADAPLVTWDVMHGLAGINQMGRQIVTKLLDGVDPAIASARPSDALSLAEKLPEDSILFFLNGHRFYNDPVVAQAIWNLRDPFKARGNMLVVLAAPGATLPPELASDVLLLDEPLPTIEDLKRIVLDTFSAADLGEPTEGTMTKATDALIGLAAFPAEQALAMSLSPKGLDTEGLWERKRKLIEQTPGLSIWRGGDSFDQIGGAGNIKQFLSAVLTGVDPPRVIVFIDEIEKAFAGTGTDLSGVKTEMTGTMLTWMQDCEADGCIFIGPPGCAKSAVGKAAGNLAEILTIAFDLSAMQTSLVGASGERLRMALNIVEAVSQGRAMFIATCNSIGSLPPELRRRFTLGTFFFDLPTAEEREAIWKIYRAKYRVSGALPDDEGWTGAEIKECCRKAYRLKISLKEAAEYIVPVSQSAAEQIRTLRQQASGKFISASKAGVYRFEEPTVTSRRKIREEVSRAL
jgi:hypothetical protein